ncbi:uncharacterized protein LOC142538957 [Primulina tabacum]|uniref:uncharacterized protein LOC142538957 n=1 Tax=Primulina tabacum TaxID=48773 RepID=UPI003F5A8057
MPQVDLVSACAGGGNDRKIVCETLADDNSPENEFIADEEDTDFPPESFWLSKDAEYDWFDRNAFFERRDSTKGNANSASLNHNSNHSSQRFSFTLKSKASIIGLPKTQKNTFVDSSRRTCRSVNVRLFPKRSTSVRKSTIAIIDPGSPNVSCIGRVRSKRGRRKSNSSKRTEKPPETSREKLVQKPKTGADKKKKKKKKKGGFYSKLMSVFRSKKADKNPDRSSSHKIVEVSEEKPAAVEAQWRSLSQKAASEPPTLGGLTRFASGRRSGYWAAEDFNQVVSESLELDPRARVMAEGEY